MTRAQVVLVLLLAVVIGFGLGWLARGGGFDYAADRFRDTAAALKRMYRQRGKSNTPREHVLAPQHHLPPGMGPAAQRAAEW